MTESTELPELSAASEQPVAIQPMTIMEALECAKIFIPHARVLRDAQDGLDLLERIYSVMSGDLSIELVRALALMEHQPLGDTVDKYRGLGGTAMLRSLRDHLAVNPLPDLIESAAMLGLTSERWTHA